MRNAAAARPSGTGAYRRSNGQEAPSTGQAAARRTPTSASARVRLRSWRNPITKSWASTVVSVFAASAQPMTRGPRARKRPGPVSERLATSTVGSFPSVAAVGPPVEQPTLVSGHSGGAGYAGCGPRSGERVSREPPGRPGDAEGHARPAAIRGFVDGQWLYDGTVGAPRPFDRVAVAGLLWIRSSFLRDLLALDRIGVHSVVMSNSGTSDGYFWCLRHSRVETASEACAAMHRLGPYPTAAEAERALQTVRERNEAWDAEDARWSGEEA